MSTKEATGNIVCGALGLCLITLREKMQIAMVFNHGYFDLA